MEANLTEELQSNTPKATPSMKRWLRHAPAVAAFLVLVASAAPFANLHWWPNLIAHFRPQLVIVLSLLCFALLFQRRWILAVIALTGSAANLGAMVTQAGSPLPMMPPSANSPRVRLISVNVLQGNKRLDLLEQFIRTSDADVLVFQEVTFKTANLLAKLKTIYPGQFMHPMKNSKGCALLTRLPLISARWERTPGLEAVGAIVAEIESTTGRFAVLDIHSHKPTNEKDAASQGTYFQWIGAKVQETQQRGLPTVVAGDFNSTLWARALQDFTAKTQLSNVNQGILFDATWSRWLPQRLMIDHVFLTPEWSLVGREVGPATGSDHRPLIVDLARAR